MIKSDLGEGESDGGYYLGQVIGTILSFVTLAVAVLLIATVVVQVKKHNHGDERERNEKIFRELYRPSKQLPKQHPP